MDFLYSDCKTVVWLVLTKWGCTKKVLTVHKGESWLHEILILKVVNQEIPILTVLPDGISLVKWHVFLHHISFIEKCQAMAPNWSLKSKSLWVWMIQAFAPWTYAGVLALMTASATGILSIITRFSYCPLSPSGSFNALGALVCLLFLFKLLHFIARMHKMCFHRQKWSYCLWLPTSLCLGWPCLESSCDLFSTNLRSNFQYRFDRGMFFLSQSPKSFDNN